VFLEVQIVMVKFYGVIDAMEEVQNMGFTNVWLECDSAWFVLRLMLELMFCGCFVIEILVLITMGKSGLRLLIFFIKGMCVLISWLI